MTSTGKGWSVKKIVPLALVLVLLIIGLLGWGVIRYHSYCGYVSYNAQRHIGFDLYDAEQTLVNHGYSVTVDSAPTDYEWPYLKTSDISIDGDMTLITISVEYYYQIRISAHREIYIPPYAVIGDLHELERKHQNIAEEDTREVLEIVGLPTTGEFTHRDNIDSLDFFLPTTVFYILLLLHFPLTGISIVWFILSRFQKQGPQ